MDPLPPADRCTCSPRVVRGGKEYPPKMGEGSPGQEKGVKEKEEEGEGEEGGEGKKGAGLVDSSANPGVESTVQGLK